MLLCCREKRVYWHLEGPHVSCSCQRQRLLGRDFEDVSSVDIVWRWVEHESSSSRWVFCDCILRK